MKTALSYSVISDRCCFEWTTTLSRMQAPPTLGDIPGGTLVRDDLPWSAARKRGPDLKSLGKLAVALWRVMTETSMSLVHALTRRTQ